MSLDQVEAAIREMPAEERGRLLLWLDEHRYELFAGEDVTDAQRAELLLRRSEYETQRESFARVETEDALNRFFQDIRREVHTRISSAAAH